MYNELIHNRLDALRSRMKLEAIDYYLFVTADFHSSEYVCDHFKSREYFSGFNGSNGDLLVWKDGAALWTDGRYFLQASEQLEGTGIELMKMGMKDVPTVEEFLEKNMLPGETFGFDGRCIPLSRGKAFEEVCAKVNAKACKDAENPSDCKVILKDLSESVWSERPELPANKVWLLKKENTGESRAERLTKVREKMKEKNAKALVLSSLDEIAWLFLLRGADIEFNPVALSYAIIFENSVNLYINPEILLKEVSDELEKDGIKIFPYNDIYEYLSNDFSKAADTVMIDPSSISYTLYQSITDGYSKEINQNENNKNILQHDCPITLMKACKTPEEIEFERQAHIKDGVAVTKLLYHLCRLRENEDFKSGKKKVTELQVADKLLGLRQDQEGFLDQSFAPIIATAEHGAIIHYEPDEKSNAVIKKDAFLLMDTGGQYMEGTTDITRTVMMGEPTEEEKRLYTAVLCGNLRLADAVFPEGTNGTNLDILARQELWNLGLDYRHGTGHGVGYILNVHEGPQNISLRSRSSKPPVSFKEGMITSDEPGIYLDGKFGIRLENMMVCLEAGEYKDSEYGPFYRFETLTMVPFDRRSIDPKLMSKRDKELLNAYHDTVFKTISPYLNADEVKWLEAETANI